MQFFAISAVSRGRRSFPLRKGCWSFPPARGTALRSRLTWRKKALARIADQTHAFTIDYVRQPAAPQPKKPQGARPIAAQRQRGRAGGPRQGPQAAYQVADAAYAVAEKEFDDEMKQALEKLSPKSLQNYDAVVFCYTSGDLPLPDFNGLLAWIKAGHGFVGLGNAFETMVSYPPYFDMLGFGADAAANKVAGVHYKTANARWNHFEGKQSWTQINVQNQAPKKSGQRRGFQPSFPSRFSLTKYWILSCPIRRIRRRCSPSTKTRLMGRPAFSRWPGVTNMGRDGSFSPRWTTRTYGRKTRRWGRKNSPEIARLFLTHLQDGVLWALGVDPGAVGNR